MKMFHLAIYINIKQFTHTVARLTWFFNWWGAQIQPDWL